MPIGIGLDWMCSVLRPHQHSIGYMGDGFYRSKDPTNSIKVLKEKLQKKITQRTKKTQNTHAYTQNGKTNTAYNYNITSPLVYNNMGWLGDSSHRGQWMAVGLPIGKPWHKVTARVQKQLTEPCYSQWSLIWFSYRPRDWSFTVAGPVYHLHCPGLILNWIQTAVKNAPV